MGFADLHRNLLTTGYLLLDTVMDDMYREVILEHYKHPHNAGTLEHPDISHEDHNPLCGDRIRIDLQIADMRAARIEDTKDGRVRVSWRAG
jgi:hypothetical protein